jgi:hypothetical protein
MRQNKHVFSLLPALLTETLTYSLPTVSEDTIPKDHAVDSVSEYMCEYDWYLYYRTEITLLLGAWGDSQAIPSLAQALQQSLQLEYQTSYPNNLVVYSQQWHTFQDSLAYALGQLKAWNILTTLELPAKRSHIAQRYLVFGFLQAQVPWIFYSLFLDSWGKEDRASRSIFVSSGADPRLGLPDPEVVEQIMHEHFFLHAHDEVPSFSLFVQWHEERTYEWKDRWDAECNAASKH